MTRQANPDSALEAGKRRAPSPEDFQLRKYSVVLHGHRTSVSLERVFRDTLVELAQDRGCSANRLIEMIDAARTTNLSSAIRVFVIRSFKDPDASHQRSPSIAPAEGALQAG
jgi:predicted DNA-binding ribbon-helix-helix protein